MQRLTKLFLLAVTMYSMQAAATILPPNDLYKFDRVGFISNITEKQFNDISNSVTALYADLAKEHGATLTMIANWKDSTVNAYADQSGDNWTVHMFGGLARRSEVTPDGFAMVVCHELGHHFGGYYFYGDQEWAAGEGEADYFATQACAHKVFKTALTQEISEEVVPAIVKNKCDTAWKTTADQNICYRTSMAGYSLAKLLSVLGGTTSEFETPDTSKVKSTNVEHPEGQCRLDTYFAGGLCTVAFDDHLIPGKDLAEGGNSAAAEEVAAKTSCMTKEGFTLGVRPLCWFKPLR